MTFAIFTSKQKQNDKFLFGVKFKTVRKSNDIYNFQRKGKKKKIKSPFF